MLILEGMTTEYVKNRKLTHLIFLTLPHQAQRARAAMLLARSSQPDEQEIVLAGSVFTAKKSIFFLILPFIVSFTVRISKLKVRRVLF